MDNKEYGSINHNISISERKNIVISGVKKLNSFDNKESCNFNRKENIKKDNYNKNIFNLKLQNILLLNLRKQPFQI